MMTKITRKGYGVCAWNDETKIIRRRRLHISFFFVPFPNFALVLIDRV